MSIKDIKAVIYTHFGPFVTYMLYFYTVALAVFSYDTPEERKKKDEKAKAYAQSGFMSSLGSLFFIGLLFLGIMQFFSFMPLLIMLSLSMAACLLLIVLPPLAFYILAGGNGERKALSDKAKVSLKTVWQNYKKAHSKLSIKKVAKIIAFLLFFPPSFAIEKGESKGLFEYKFGAWVCTIIYWIGIVLLVKVLLATELMPILIVLIFLSPTLFFLLVDPSSLVSASEGIDKLMEAEINEIEPDEIELKDIKYVKKDEFDNSEDEQVEEDSSDDDSDEDEVDPLSSKTQNSLEIN